MKTLLFTYKEVHQIYMDFFADYCIAVAGEDTLLLQLMLTDKPLQHWFSRQWKNGEQRFFAYMSGIRTPMSIAKARALYIRMATDHIDKYSKKIIYELKRKTKNIRRGAKKTDASNQVYSN